MRYPKDHKDTSRQRLVELSGSHAKKHGFTDSGMAALAASAGATRARCTSTSMAKPISMWR